MNNVERINCDKIVKRIRSKKNCEELKNTDAREEIMKRDTELKEVIINEKYTETKAEFDIFGRLKSRDFGR